MTTNVIKIFIWTHTIPARGKWYELDTDAEEAQAKWDELCNGSSEPLISDNESDFNLIGENSLSYYIEMQECLGDLDEDDTIKAQMLLMHDKSYFKDADLLRSAINNTSLHTGDMKDYAEDYFEEYLRCVGIDKNVIEEIMRYFDAESYALTLETGWSYAQETIDGQDYVLSLDY